MAVYHLDEGAFDLPDLGFQDRTVHTLEARIAGGKELGLLVARAEIPLGKSLRDLVAEHLLNEAKRLGGYSILDEQESVIAGVPAIEVRSRWRHAGTVFYQRQAHLVALHTWLIFAMTTPLSAQAIGDESMD